MTPAPDIVIRYGATTVLIEAKIWLGNSRGNVIVSSSLGGRDAHVGVLDPRWARADHCR